MATIDEVLDAMADEAAASFEYLIIDPDARAIIVPEAEQIFGVEEDREAERKHFKCPRYVGDDLDLADMHLTVYFRNANGDEDGYLVSSMVIYGDYVTFSWKLSEKVTAYPGEIQFSVCAARSKDGEAPDWNTTWATGTVLEGLGHADVGDVEEQTSDLMTQLRETVAAQTVAVEQTGAEQVAAVKAQGSTSTQEAVAAIQAQGAATLDSLPVDYTALAGTVDGLTRSRAAAIVCEAQGAAIQVHDASADPLQGLRLFGRSTQDGTPTPDAPVEIVSLAAPVVTVSDGTGDNVQTLTVTTPEGLPGIPVASGGNYTDANGQQWIADEVDLARGVYVQRVGVRSLTGAEAFEDYIADNGAVTLYLSHKNSSHIICSHAVYGKGVYWANTSRVAFRVVHWGVSTMGEFKTLVAECHSTGFPVTLCYVLATPVEHALTDAEVQAFRALHSVKPTTTVLNDAGAFMALEYAADPKLYIDRRIAELIK